MMIGLVWTREGRCYEMEFNLDELLAGFHESQLPPEIECVEIISIRY